MSDVLHRPFDVEIHKRVFINYLEVLILEDGEVVYATPSHQEKLIALACEIHKVTRDELNNMCPQEYYFDFITWLCIMTKAISVWNNHAIGEMNEKQKEVLMTLKEEGLYKGVFLNES